MKLGRLGSSEPRATTVFAPVRSQTAFEETLERLGTAIKLGLLEPGTRLPAERELCGQLGIARSTLRQALTALVQSGHLRAVRGRGGGTFVAESPPVARARPRPSCSPAGATPATRGWRSSSASRCSRPSARQPRRDRSARRAGRRDGRPLDDFPAYRQADVRFHIGLAEATGTPRSWRRRPRCRAR